LSLETPRSRTVTLRAVLLGLLLMPINVYWVTVIEVRWYNLDGSCLPLFITPVFMLFVVCLANLPFRRIRPDAAFTQGELLVVYIILVTSSAMSGHDTIQNLFGVIGHAHHFATPENAWEELFWQYIPDWMMVSDQKALDAFYDGDALWVKPYYFRPFLLPLLTWGGFLLALILVMLCINVLVRKPWTEDEKLAYPLVVLPLEMTRHEAGHYLFANRTMWAGFAVAAVIDTINGLHVLYPVVPEIRFIKLYDLMQHLQARPWNAMGYTRFGAYPFMVGLAFFLPSDLSFSCWFFYVVSKFERVGRAMAGWDALKGLPYLNEQATGSWIGLGVLALWATRRHFREIGRRLLGRRSELRDVQEPISYQAALGGIAVGSLLLILWGTKAGMTVWAMAWFLVIYYLLAIAITRVRAELGTPHEIYYVNPQVMMTQIAGVKAFGDRDLTILSCMYWFNRCYRSHPMPNQLEAFKIADQARMDRRRLLWVIALATFVGILVSYWANLSVTFQEGAQARCRGFKAWVGWESFNRLRTWMISPEETNWAGVAFMAIGFAIVWALKALRFRFTGLPFHPAGYALAISFAMDYFWSAFLVSWAIKSVIMRYWGMKAHQKAVWFFMGLILGDYVVGSIWAIIGPAFGVNTYKIFI
jgi:hypothetical protein